MMNAMKREYHEGRAYPCGAPLPQDAIRSLFRAKERAQLGTATTRGSAAIPTVSIVTSEACVFAARFQVETPVDTPCCGPRAVGVLLPETPGADTSSGGSAE